jgi:hypothetical protein
VTPHVVTVSRSRSAYRAIWRFAPYFLDAFQEFDVLPIIVPLSETGWRLAMSENAQFAESLHQGVIMFARPLENEIN